MKVIKPGRSPDGWSAQRKCTGAGNNGGGCGAVLLVEAADLFITRAFERDGSDPDAVARARARLQHAADAAERQHPGAAPPGFLEALTAFPDRGQMRLERLAPELRLPFENELCWLEEGS